MLFSANLKFLFPSIPSILDKYIAAHAAGFIGVECGDVYQNSIEELVDVQKQTNLQQVLLNIVTQGDSVGCAACPDQIEQFKKDLEVSIQYCIALGCKKLHILAGKLTDCYGGNHDEVMKSWRKTFIQNLQFASERVLKENITLLIEPISVIPCYFLTGTDQALSILTELMSLGCSNVKLQLDIYHHQRLHGNISELIDKFYEFIGHIQIAQVPGRRDPDMNGEINYRYILKKLKEVGYGGWIGCEYNPREERNFDWMELYKEVKHILCEEKVASTKSY